MKYVYVIMLRQNDRDKGLHMTIDAQKLTGAEDVRWDLSDLYAGFDDPQIESDTLESKKRTQAFRDKYRGRVSELTAQELFEAIQEYESITEASQRFYIYARLAWTTNTADSTFGRELTRAESIYTEINQQLIFFGLEWLAVDDEKAHVLIDAPELAAYKHFLLISRMQSDHVLGEKEELVASELNLTGISAWRRYFGEVMSSSRYILDGEPLTQSAVLRNLYAPDRDLRERSANAMTAGLEKNLHAATYVFNTMARHKQSMDKLRNYPHWLRSRNIDNQTEDSVVEALVNSVTARYDIVSRHYRLAQKVLNLDVLYDYDRYAPLSSDTKEVTWLEGQDIVLSAFNRFSPQMANIAQEFFDKNWIDAALQANKRGGAYSASTIASVHPYIFMNFVGTLDSVQTLAHELGHGVHQYLSRQVGNLQQSTPLTTAEMASTFAEMLVFNALLEKEADPAQRLSMRMDKVTDAFATVFRQLAMNRFENALHTAVREQGELTSDQISELWIATQRQMYGDSVTLRDDYRLWWSYIPHFIDVPGYVYAYAFGELLVWALYANYQTQGGDFADRYLDALSKGGSVWPEDLVQPLGVDLKDENFWHRGLDLIEDMIAQSEKDFEEMQ